MGCGHHRGCGPSDKYPAGGVDRALSHRVRGPLGDAMDQSQGAGRATGLGSGVLSSDSLSPLGCHPRGREDTGGVSVEGVSIPVMVTFGVTDSDSWSQGLPCPGPGEPPWGLTRGPRAGNVCGEPLVLSYYCLLPPSQRPATEEERLSQSAGIPCAWLSVPHHCPLVWQGPALGSNTRAGQAVVPCHSCGDR